VGFYNDASPSQRGEAQSEALHSAASARLEPSQPHTTDMGARANSHSSVHEDVSAVNAHRAGSIEGSAQWPIVIRHSAFGIRHSGAANMAILPKFNQ
jgi:hypothetical protein